MNQINLPFTTNKIKGGNSFKILNEKEALEGDYDSRLEKLKARQTLVEQEVNNYV